MKLMAASTAQQTHVFVVFTRSSSVLETETGMFKCSANNSRALKVNAKIIIIKIVYCIDKTWVFIFIFLM